MVDSKKIERFVETVNSYYAFALLLYTGALFVAANTDLFVWLFVIATPLVAGWGGYLVHAFFEQRRQRHGFRIIEDKMVYELTAPQRATLKYTTKIQAETNHLMVYPIGYQWSGSGEEGTPKLLNKNQQLLTLADTSTASLGKTKSKPYIASTVSTDGEWHYWFVALNPPVHKNDQVEVKYTQDFYDKKNSAKPYLYYFVRTKLQRLELQVAFPTSSAPKAITGSYIKPSQPSRPYPTPGLVYDQDQQRVTWIIEKPKKGYCYRIHWQ